MADYTKILNHVAKFEGGLSSDPDDNASRFPSPIKDAKGRPYHTNKGVVWATWVNYSKIKGIAVDANKWFNMTEATWRDIVKKLYWDPYKLDNLNSQGIAEIIFEAYWGGGGSVMAKDVQTKLRQLGFNVSVDGSVGNETIKALNQAIKKPGAEKMFIEYMTQERLKYLKGLSDWWKYGKGWTNRVLAAQDRAISFITKNTGTLTGILILGVVSFLAYKSLNSSN
jgi:lysozyme family protein